MNLPSLSLDDQDLVEDYASDISRRSKQAPTVNAFGAELAIARWVGVSWPNSISTYQGPDVGFWCQVKWRSPISKIEGLYVEINPRGFTRKPETYVYVLVGGEMPDFHLKGWIGGADFVGSEFVSMNGKSFWHVTEGNLRKDWEILKKLVVSRPDPKLSPPRSKKKP